MREHVSSPESVLDALQSLRTTLEAVFPLGWFDRSHTGHPAWDWWTALSRIEQSGGTRVPSLSDADAVCAFCEMMFLGARFVSALGGTFAEGVSGRLDCYGSLGLQRQLHGTLEDSSQFMDRLVELTRTAWHIEQGHSVEPLSGPGSS